GRHDRQHVVAQRDLDAETAEASGGLHLHLAVALRIEEGRVRIEPAQRALDGVVNQVLGRNLVHVLVLDDREHLREEPKLLVVRPPSGALVGTGPPSERVSTTSSELITNAFFMRFLRLASLPQPLGRVLRLALIANFEIETRSRQRARVAHGPDPVALAHLVTFLNQDIGNVRVEREVVVAVVEDDQVSVTLEPSCVDHVAGIDRVDLRALLRFDVDPVAERLRSKTGVHLRPERRNNPTLGGPGQTTSEGTESHSGRGAVCGRWCLCNPPLLGLEISDERFEPPRRLAELTNHPFVVGSLVANFSKQLSTFSRLPVDLGLFLLGFGPKTRHLAPPS